VGTSVGLYSTTALKGDSTVWVQESQDAMGNVIVDMIDARSTDGFVAVATHGNGVYSTYYKPSTGIADHSGSSELSLGSPYPVPSDGFVNLPVTSGQGENLEISLSSSSGTDLGIIYRGHTDRGKSTIQLNLKSLAPGVYYLTAVTSSARQTKKIIVM